MRESVGSPWRYLCQPCGCFRTKFQWESFPTVFIHKIRGKTDAKRQQSVERWGLEVPEGNKATCWQCAHDRNFCDIFRCFAMLLRKKWFLWNNSESLIEKVKPWTCDLFLNLFSSANDLTTLKLTCCPWKFIYTFCALQWKENSWKNFTSRTRESSEKSSEQGLITRMFSSNNED